MSNEYTVYTVLLKLYVESFKIERNMKRKITTEGEKRLTDFLWILKKKVKMLENLPLKLKMSVNSTKFLHIKTKIVC